jgi:hypothetical protein
MVGKGGRSELGLGVFGLAGALLLTAFWTVVVVLVFDHFQSKQEEHFQNLLSANGDELVEMRLEGDLEVQFGAGSEKAVAFFLKDRAAEGDIGIVCQPSRHTGLMVRGMKGQQIQPIRMSDRMVEVTEEFCQGHLAE